MSNDPHAARERRIEKPPARATTDSFGEVFRMQNKAFHSQHDDLILAFRAILKAVTLPFWLPFWLLKRYRTRQEMIRLGKHWQDRGLSHREMAVKWVERLPQEYPLGEYDPRTRKIETRFRRLLRKHIIREQ